MIGLVVLLGLGAVAATVLLTVALAAGVVKLAFRAVLLPLTIGLVAVKVVVAFVVLAVAATVIAAVGIPLLALAAVFAVPLLLVGGIVWAGVHVLV